MMKSRIASGILLFAFAFVGTIRADIIFGTGSSTATQNIGSYTQTDTNEATGALLIGGDDALLAVADVGLTVPAAGAARIEQDGTPFTSVVFTPIGPTWTVFELNAIYAGTDGTFKLVAEDDGGTIWTSSDFTLSNGNNRVWAQAINGQQIVELTVEASGALINDIRQIRITQAIPEPSTMAVAGIACLAGIGLVIRRKKKSV